jgi:hypothetical protein
VDVCLSFTLVFILPTITATPNLPTADEDGASISLSRPLNFRRAENILETSFIPIRKSSSSLLVRSRPSERRPQFTMPATCYRGPIYSECSAGVHRASPQSFQDHTRVSQSESRERPNFNATQNIPLACLIAARVSQKLRFVYALARLALSLEIMSAPTIDLDPTHSPNIPKSVFPEDHIRLAMAITSAYSSIEELGLTIRASSQNPSRIIGAWNPVVRSDLEDRLRGAGVNLDEEFLLEPARHADTH